MVVSLMLICSLWPSLLGTTAAASTRSLRPTPEIVPLAGGADHHARQQRVAEVTEIAGVPLDVGAVGL